MSAKPAAPARPPILMRQSDFERLSALGRQCETTSPEQAGLLLQEVERAKVRPDHLVPGDVVGMNSTVEFVDEGHGRSRVVQLVYPGDADIGAGRISVLTPVGAGLIGLKAGQSILWPDRHGQKRALTVVRVDPPAP